MLCGFARKGLGGKSFTDILAQCTFSGGETTTMKHDHDFLLCGGDQCLQYILSWLNEFQKV